MSWKVWKYPIPIQDEVTLLMPADAKPIAFQIQGDLAIMWAVVDPHAPNELRKFAVIGTGHADIPTPHEYIGTIQRGQFVWHLFECGAS